MDEETSEKIMNRLEKYEARAIDHLKKDNQIEMLNGLMLGMFFARSTIEEFTSKENEIKIPS